MTVSISLYDHTARRFADGSNAVNDTYKVKLLTAATFDASHTTLAATGGTEVANANGYATGGATLANVTVSTAATNGAAFDADDLVWAATGGPISASHAIVYNDTDTDDPPLAFIDFGGSHSAGAGFDFKLVWNAGGIFTWTVPS